MVKLDKWEDINKPLFRKHVPQTISARELFVFRQFEQIFSKKQQDAEAHQCFCGQLFLVRRERLQDVKKDFLGNLVCPKCAESPEDSEDYQWRRKFELFRKLTEAMQELERSVPENRSLHEEKVRELSRGLFEFKNMKELYIEYFKLMEELDDKEQYSLRFRQSFQEAIKKLFRKGKEQNLMEFIKFIFSPDPNETQHIEETIWESNLSVIRTEKDYFLGKVSDYPILIKPISQGDLTKSRLIAQLLLYCHLIEIDTLYNLSLNLAVVANGGTCVKNPFPKSVVYPMEKIKFIEKASQGLAHLLREVYSKEVRNAFAHSKYSIEGDYFVKTDQDFRISIEDLQNKIHLLNDYWRFLFYMIGREQVQAMEYGEMKTKSGDTIKINVGWVDEKSSSSHFSL
jgi:hypothetical protein